MDQKDSANNQSIVKTIMMGSRILAQGIYKGEAAKGAIQIKIGQKLFVGLFGNLLKIKELIGDFSEQDIILHAQLWVEAMRLPRQLLASLKCENDNKINFIRSSCCLADKINEELCANCPKLHKKKQ